jgi:hypothetical protein
VRIYQDSISHRHYYQLTNTRSDTRRQTWGQGNICSDAKAQERETRKQPLRHTGKEKEKESEREREGEGEREREKERKHLLTHKVRHKPNVTKNLMLRRQSLLD